MLHRQPEIGQLVMGLQDDFWEDGYPIVLKDEKYEIVGYGEGSRNPYYLCNGDKIYIDEDSWHLYDLVESINPKDASWFFDRIMELSDK